MRIYSAATAYIDAPSSKGDPFRAGPPMKNKNKSRSFTRLFSSPIRKMGKQLTKRSKKGKSQKVLVQRDEEQGWIAQASTFETEGTLSPRSDGTLTTGDSSTLLSHQQVDEESGRLLQILPGHYMGVEEASDQYFDLEAGLQEQFIDTSALYETIVQYRHTSETDGSEEPSQNAQESMVQEDTTNPIPTDICSDAVGEQDEDVDSLAPAVDFQLFHEDEDHEDFRCVGRLSTPNAAPPVEIDIKNDMLINTDNNFKEHQFDEEDDMSSTSSYNSYLQVVQNISSSVNNQVNTVTNVSVEEVEIGIPRETRQVYMELPGIESESASEDDFDDDESFVVSFNPSNELILQAMEGASMRAKFDIERATSLALSKINMASSIREVVADRAKARGRHSTNRILGFLLFVILFFNMGGKSLIQSMASSTGMDNFQMAQQSNDVVVDGHDLTMWVEKNAAPTSIIPKSNNNELSRNYENAHNVACVFKLGCLAFGCI